MTWAGTFENITFKGFDIFNKERTIKRAAVSERGIRVGELQSSREDVALSDGDVDRFAGVPFTAVALFFHSSVGISPGTSRARLTPDFFPSPRAFAHFAMSLTLLSFKAT